MNHNAAETSTSTDNPDTRRGRMQARRARNTANITAYPATRSAAILVLPSHDTHTPGPAQIVHTRTKQLLPTS